MAQAYHSERMEQLAVFELVFRKMPANRNYIVAAGFADVLAFLIEFQFIDDELDSMRLYQEFSEAYGFLTQPVLLLVNREGASHFVIVPQQ